MAEAEVPGNLKVILAEQDVERERETLLDNRFRVIDVHGDDEVQTYKSLPCCKAFWRCFVGNFTYRLAVSILHTGDQIDCCFTLYQKETV